MVPNHKPQCKKVQSEVVPLAVPSKPSSLSHSTQLRLCYMCEDSETRSLTLKERLVSVALKGPLLECYAWKELSHEDKLHDSLTIESEPHSFTECLKKLN